VQQLLWVGLVDRWQQIGVRDHLSEFDLLWLLRQG
jgi:hypothetical protein